jgi:predicted DNA-binding transcriptional regulator YafY
MNQNNLVADPYDSQKANDRLEKIVDFFWKGGRATTKELADKFHVDQRTINNDLKRILALEQDKRYYYLPASYIQMRPYEKAAMSGAIMMALFAKAVPEMSDNIESLFAHPPAHRNTFLFDLAFEAIEDETRLTEISIIIDAGRGAELVYTNNEGKTGTYYTFPLRIANFNGYWYLLAYDALADRIKSFRLNAISQLTAMDEDPVTEEHKDRLHRHIRGTVSSWIGDEIKHVHLTITGDARRYFVRKPYDMLRILDDDGATLHVEAAYFNDIEILRLVSQWLPHITIVDNPPLQEAMRNRLDQALKHSSGD